MGRVGEKDSEETRQKKREAWAKRLSNPNYIHHRKGTKHSEETKKIISEKQIGISKNVGSKNGAYGKRGKDSPNYKRVLRKCNRCKQKSLITLEAIMCKCCWAIRYQIKRLYNLSIEEYDEITKECLLCKFAKIVSLHHLNGRGNSRSTGNSRKDNRKENMIGLCPNHHRLLHSRIYGDETHQQILKKLEI